jgi:hypothetical protein
LNISLINDGTIGGLIPKRGTGQKVSEKNKPYAGRDYGLLSKPADHGLQRSPLKKL